MKQMTFDCYGFGISGDKYEHPQVVIKNLGITYEHATPQSMGDCWWFWNCTNIPGDLPTYIKVVERDPIECIGFGLNKETAVKLSNSLVGGNHE